MQCPTESMGVLINMCSSEAPFLRTMITECSKFARQENIVISYADTLYSGDADDTSYIDVCRAEFPLVKCVQYVVDVTLPVSQRRGVVHRPTAYWHNVARYVGSQGLSEAVDWVFVLDGDEVPDGSRVLEWLKMTILWDIHTSYKMGTYWYFKLATHQAETFEDSILLIHRSHLTADTLFGDMERDHLISRSGTRLTRMNMGMDGLPLWHHFSFVRSRENLRKKMTSWGHRDDMLKGTDVDLAVAYVFKNDAVNDFIHKYTYRTVPNRFDFSL